MVSQRCSSHLFPLRNCLVFQAWKYPHLKRAFEPFAALSGCRTPCREVPNVQFQGKKCRFLVKFNDSRKITFCFHVSRQTYHSQFTDNIFHNNGSRRIKTRDHVSRETPLRPLLYRIGQQTFSLNQPITTLVSITKTPIFFIIYATFVSFLIESSRCHITWLFFLLTEIVISMINWEIIGLRVVRSHTRDKQIGVPLRSRPILLSLLSLVLILVPRGCDPFGQRHGSRAGLPAPIHGLPLFLRSLVPSSKWWTRTELKNANGYVSALRHRTWAQARPHLK